MRDATKGPWYSVGRAEEKDDFFVCFVASSCPDKDYEIPPAQARGETEKQVLANANLIAAAPDLLYALEQARAALPDAWFAVGCNVPREVIDLINAAISKATGGER